VVVRRDPPVVILLAGYLAFWAPWLMSPRIMFLYHYLPSLPFLYIGLAWAITRTGMSRRTIVALLCAAGVAFALIYPYVTAVYLPEALRPGGWRWR
jgi:dolichyl-phosphate-mannose--protein O-mannosyl transferase